MNTQTACPDCKKQLAIPAGFTLWCPDCEWNLQPEKDAGTAYQTVFDLYYLKFSEKLGLQLFEHLKSENLIEKNDLGKVTGLALAFSLAVLAVYLAMAGGALLILLLFWGRFFWTVLACMMLGFVFLATPKGKKAPHEPHELSSRQELPQLYTLFDQLCGVLALQPIDGIVLNHAYNAAVTVYKGKRYLHLGLSMWQMLTPEERLSLLGHELGHLRHEDPIKAKLPAWAISVLFQTGNAICPGNLGPRYEGDLFIEDRAALDLAELMLIPINWLLALIAHGFWGLGDVLLGFLWADSQRAEYRADLNSLALAPLEACLSDLEKTGLEDFLNDQARQMIIKRETGEPAQLYKQALARWENLPTYERERRRRLLKKESHRVDATHPCTSFRLEMLSHQASRVQPLTLPPIDWLALDSELAPQVEIQAGKWIDQVRAEMYA